MSTLLQPQPLTWPGESELRDTILGYVNKYKDANANLGNLTPQEQSALKYLDQYLAGGTSPYMEAGGQEILKTLAGDYNPEDSAYYAPTISGIDKLKNQSIDRIRRSSQLGGNLSSTARLKAEGDTSSDYDSKIASLMLDLQSQERDKMFQAVPYAFNYGQYQENIPLAKAEAARTVGSIPRDLQTQALGLGSQTLMGYKPSYYFPTYVDSKRNGGWGGALSGAASGAMTGSMFGPWGTAIGAGVGGLAGYFG